MHSSAHPLITLNGEHSDFDGSRARRDKPWKFGEVVENRGQRLCVVNISSGLIRRNHKQIRKAEVRQQELYKPKQGDLDMMPLPEETVPPPTTVEPASISPPPMSSPSSPVPREPALAPLSPKEGTHVPLRRSTRVRRPPTRWGNYIQ